jgi:hypothetical protein
MAYYYFVRSYCPRPLFETSDKIASVERDLSHVSGVKLVILTLALLCKLFSVVTRCASFNTEQYQYLQLSLRYMCGDTV